MFNRLIKKMRDILNAPARKKEASDKKLRAERQKLRATIEDAKVALKNLHQPDPVDPVRLAQLQQSMEALQETVKRVRAAEASKNLLSAKPPVP